MLATELEQGPTGQQVNNLASVIYKVPVIRKAAKAPANFQASEYLKLSGIWHFGNYQVSN